jgi:hypothetical protein
MVMRKSRIAILAVAGSLTAVGVLSQGMAQTPQPSQPTAADLLKRIEKLEHDLQVQQDIEAVRRLQHTYNYYNTSGLHKQAMALVSDHADSIEIGGRGVYKGKEGFLRAFTTYDSTKKGVIGDFGYQFGDVLFQLAGQDVITISDDGKTAKGRFEVLTPAFRGFPNTQMRLNAGNYEMEYAKENGKWMITKFKYVHVFAVAFPDLKVAAGYSTLPDGRADAPTTWYHPYPETGTLPFHFPNPIIGEFPPDVVSPKHYWIGNWPGEFGKTGHVE